MRFINKKSVVSFFSVLACILSINTYADGNRYDLTRLYHSEISAAKAYILTSHSRGNNSQDAFANAVIIDVRKVEEFIAGHPPGAYSIPFPHITGSPNTPDDSDGYIGYDVSDDNDVGFGAVNDGVLPVSDFTDYVQATFPDKSTPILTLCRTGYRSVQAANALAKVGYTNVRNIWQGYVGRTKTDTNGNVLDLNNDGNPANDTDGWAYYQELPTSKQLHPGRVFAPYSYLYY